MPKSGRQSARADAMNRLLVLCFVASAALVAFFSAAQAEEAAAATTLVSIVASTERMDLGPDDIEDIEISFDMNAQPVLNLKFCEDAARVFARITAEMVGRPLAIWVDGQLMSEPVVRERIAGGAVMVSGAFSVEELAAIVEDVETKLPAHGWWISQRCPHD